MQDFLRYLLEHARQYKKEIFFVLLGSFLVGISTGLMAYTLKPLLDDLFISKDKNLLYLLPTAIFFIYVGKGIGRFLKDYYSAFISGSVSNSIRVIFLEHIVSLDLNTFNKLGSGQIIGKIISDVDKIKLFLLNNVSNFIKSIVSVIFLIALIVYHSPKLAFVSLVILPLMIYPLLIFAKRMKIDSKTSQDKISIVVHKINEILHNFEIIKSFNSEKIEISKFKARIKEYFSFYMKAEKTNALISPMMEIGSSIAIGVAIIVGGMEVINETMSVGSFVSFITALIFLYEPIKSLSIDYNRLQECVASYDRLKEVFDIKSVIIDGGKILNEKIVNISFCDTSLKYTEKLVLENINADILENDTVALIGNSGGGKSSFSNLISRFYDASSGEVLINGQNIKNYNKASLRSKISLVSQSTFIFNDTIANNITYANTYNKERLKKAIKQAYCEFVYDFELGIDTILDEYGSNISGGQKQRIAIARAIYKNPDVYIFDEATSALDNESELFIKQSIKELAKNKIVILIAHRISSIEYANKIFLFRDGEIVASGNSKDIKTNKFYLQLVGEMSN
ncbi:Phospholipid-lipopolysaccharide ABC transporter [hydrothermal vent metagenome]|uniref:Phospholipid-lipopolysaccharide ABC transporter n=1 Tax=hydrothermal vent metagenome TaxID=652676 RepID=A0A3B1DW84_9ZZZZ